MYSDFYTQCANQIAFCASYLFPLFNVPEFTWSMAPRDSMSASRSIVSARVEAQTTVWPDGAVEIRALHLGSQVIGNCLFVFRGEN